MRSESPIIFSKANELDKTTKLPVTNADYLAEIKRMMEPKASLIDRLLEQGVLNNWVNERTKLTANDTYLQKIRERWTTIIGAEQRARRKIAEAIRSDLTTNPTMDISRVPYAPSVSDSLAFKIAGHAIFDANQWLKYAAQKGIALRIRRPDTITGEIITAELFTNHGHPERYGLPGQVWIAREIGEGGHIITEAKICNGTNLLNTELTIDHTGPRYEGSANADPQIRNIRYLEQAAATTFSLLTYHVLGGVKQDLDTPQQASQTER